MKRLVAVLLVLAMTFSMIACSSGDSSNTGNVSETQTETSSPLDNTDPGTVEVEEDAKLDTFTSVYYEEIPVLNPYNLTNTTEMKMTANTLDGLVENTNTGKYVPALADSWEVNDDFTVWTFKLKEGIKWVDYQGNETDFEVTADDFVEAMRYIADPDNNVTNVKIARDNIKGFYDYYWEIVDIQDGVITGDEDEVRKTFDDVIGIKALDTYTVEYTLEYPTPYFLSMLVTELFLPMEKAFVDAVGDDYGLTPDKMLYNGAYYLNNWQRDKQIQMVKNPFYWDAENVKIDNINMLKVADATTSLEMFKRGEIDSVGINGLQLESLLGSEYEDNIYTDMKSTVNYWFALNFESVNPEFDAFIDNHDFRKALYHGLDRTVLQQVFDAYNPANNLTNTIIPYGVVFDNDGKDYTSYDSLKPYKEVHDGTYNPELAKEYMAKAIAALAPNGTIEGVSPATVDMSPITSYEIDGMLPITITFVDSMDADNIMLAELFELTVEETFGTDVVDVVIAQFSNSKYDDVIVPGYFDIVYDSFSFKYADPAAQLGRLTTGGSVNDGRYSDETFDNMVDAAIEENDLNKRYEMFSEAEAYYIDMVYTIPYKSAGGGYSMSRTDQFQTPYGGFGITRFKYKGMTKLDHILTKGEYFQMKENAGF
ncbi:peptide ABC transporter substrate-binding protein [Acidaminobacter sp. JC074]|uniref:peptide ABC transporter substrate-binding protein n=1 Tax=Acidaminobacter sp. JC074 TaxID=2530199 RepID=UPI001F0F74EB|nr:peptide ABC transporter substrate-binding protein [Acidaminobacter sp. JC074]MCH4890868.1 peptide ABC transporter substrate-binding protein [Acidaminobacter sp. JC074]